MTLENAIELIKAEYEKATDSNEEAVKAIKERSKR